VPVYDHWWQTETGWPICGNPAGLGPLPVKYGSPTVPMPGYDLQVLDASAKPLPPGETGTLAVKLPLPPSCLPTLWGNDERFRSSYLSDFPGYYTTSDAGYVDADGYVYVMARTDDVINVAGHRLGTAEIESALVAHAKVSEAAVVGYPHDIKGQGIYAYVTLMAGEQPSEALRKELVDWVRKEIGPIASPDLIQFAPGLPKTRSGKIMRRILRKIAEDESGNLGDTSTLADPGVVDDLVSNRQNKKSA
jgi:acetyl-CoA synthetase